MPNLVEIAVKMHKDGATLREISKRVGWAQSDVRNQLQLEGIYIGKRTPRNGNTPGATIGRISRSEALRMREEGMTYKEIADIAGVTVQSVYRLLRCEIIPQSP